MGRSACNYRCLFVAVAWLWICLVLQLVVRGSCSPVVILSGEEYLPYNHELTGGNRWQTLVALRTRLEKLTKSARNRIAPTTPGNTEDAISVTVVEMVAGKSAAEISRELSTIGEHILAEFKAGTDRELVGMTAECAYIKVIVKLGHRRIPDS